MAIGRIVCGDICIAMDLFSVKKTAMKPGQTWVLPEGACAEQVRRAVYEAMSGNKWDDYAEHLTKLLNNDEVFF